MRERIFPHILSRAQFMGRRMKEAAGDLGPIAFIINPNRAQITWMSSSRHNNLGEPAVRVSSFSISARVDIYLKEGGAMPIAIGQVEAIFRYPVKSMAGERVEVADLGWHGIEGDRRLALRRTQDRSGFPWLTASKLPELLLYTPLRHEDGVQGDLPTHVRTPESKELAVFGEELAVEIERRHGAPVQMMHLRAGIFDDASVSVIATDTIREIGRLAERELDVRRFRPNIVVRLMQPNSFQEDEWLGGVLLFGEPGDGPRISVTMRDLRCSMVNFDPDSARSDPEVMKSIVRVNQNNAGIYGTVIHPGRLAIGQTIRLRKLAEQ
jgi:uncharacterized protein YcbX